MEDTVIVTATRVPERRSSTTGSMEVFTAPEIQALGSASLGDVLRMVPGLNVESTGRDGALSSLFARGGESDYNLVLVDGVRVNPSGGQFDFSRVSAAEIDRLEVVRGGQSALYGSDAIASVVQVITRRAAPGDAPSLSGSLEGGSFDSWRGDAAVLGGAQRRVDYSLGAASRGTQGAFQDILPDHDTFAQTSIDAGAGVILGDRATLRTGVRYGTAKGKAIGQIDYGSRDTGTAADTRDLSWHLDSDAPLLGPRGSVGDRELLPIVPAVGGHDRGSELQRLRDPVRHAGRDLPGQPAARPAARSGDLQRVPIGRPAARGRPVPGVDAVRGERLHLYQRIRVPPAGVPVSGERHVGRRSDCSAAGTTTSARAIR